MNQNQHGKPLIDDASALNDFAPEDQLTYSDSLEDDEMDADFPQQHRDISPNADDFDDEDDNFLADIDELDAGSTPPNSAGPATPDPVIARRIASQDELEDYLRDIFGDEHVGYKKLWLLLSANSQSPLTLKKLQDFGFRDGTGTQTTLFKSLLAHWNGYDKRATLSPQLAEYEPNLSVEACHAVIDTFTARVNDYLGQINRIPQPLPEKPSGEKTAPAVGPVNTPPTETKPTHSRSAETDPVEENKQILSQIKALGEQIQTGQIQQQESFKAILEGISTLVQTKREPGTTSSNPTQAGLDKLEQRMEKRQQQLLQTLQDTLTRLSSQSQPSTAGGDLPGSQLDTISNGLRSLLDAHQTVNQELGTIKVHMNDSSKVSGQQFNRMNGEIERIGQLLEHSSNPSVAMTQLKTILTELRGIQEEHAALLEAKSVQYRKIPAVITPKTWYIAVGSAIAFVFLSAFLLSLYLGLLDKNKQYTNNFIKYEFLRNRAKSPGGENFRRIYDEIEAQIQRPEFEEEFNRMKNASEALEASQKEVEPESKKK